MQVIALVYKDQHVQTLERSLHQWLETSISESSEDNESNTSPAERCVEESAEELTSMEPTTDDSSDGNGAGNETKKSSEGKYESSWIKVQQHIVSIFFVLKISTETTRLIKFRLVCV